MVVEEVVARVNNDVITRGDLEHARSQLRRGSAAGLPQPARRMQINAKVADGEKDLLRDLIDNSLLVQRGKDMGINVDTDVIKRLDEIRIQNNIASMEELEKQIDKSGVDFEDFKNNIRNQLLQQEVIRREVGSKIILDHAEVLKYYEDHKHEFVRPEQVVLREIFVSTEGKPDSDMPALQKKAEGLLAAGEERRGFRRTGQAFLRRQHGQAGRRPGHIRARPARSQYRTGRFLSLQRLQTTDVIPTKTGFLILQVREHYSAGQQPEDKVDSEIQDRLYNEKMRPALRDVSGNAARRQLRAGEARIHGHGSRGLKHNRRGCPDA